MDKIQPICKIVQNREIFYGKYKQVFKWWCVYFSIVLLSPSGNLVPSCQVWDRFRPIQSNPSNIELELTDLNWSKPFNPDLELV